MNLKNVLNDSYSGRIDSNYFQKEFLKFPKVDDVFELSKICLIKSGTTPTVRDESLKEGILLLKTGNIRNGVLSYNSENDFFFIDRETNLKMKSSELKKGDVLINIVGATTDVIGRCSLLSDNFPKANITQAMALLRIEDEFAKIFNPYYLFVFLISKLGHRQIRRIARPTGQFNMNLQEVGSIKIPKCSYSFQIEIEKLMQNSEKEKQKSELLYSQSEEILLKEMGLLNFQPSKEPVNIKNFKDSFGLSGRLDSEYYQVKYDELEFNIKSQKYVKINNVKTANFRGLQPVYFENGNLDIINSKHILDKSLDYKGFEKTDSKYWDIQERARVFKGDILTYTTGANIGRTQVYCSDKKALASNHVNVLRVENQNPIYIGFVMNSIVGKMQTEKLSAGSAQAELYPKDIDNFLIPIIDVVMQLKIVQLINESYKFKNKSEQLQEVAKRSLELAIEENEKTAINYINSIKF